MEALRSMRGPCCLVLALNSLCFDWVPAVLLSHLGFFFIMKNFVLKRREREGRGGGRVFVCVYMYVCMKEKARTREWESTAQREEEGNWKSLQEERLNTN